MKTPLASLVGTRLLPGGASTLAEAFLSLHDRPGPWLHVGPALAPRVYTGAEVVEQARRWRRALQDVGVRPHDRVAVVLPNDERFIGAFFGTMLAGATPIPLSWPVSGLDAAKKLEGIRPLVEAADVAAVATDDAFAGAFGHPTVTTPASRGEGVDILPSPQNPAFLQYTSGSLGKPRGAVITQRAAMTCVYAMGQGLGFSEADVGLSWLPLFHDMGLVGGLFCPVVYGFPIHLMAPGEFLLHPARWLTRAAAVRATVAAAPDFAWRLCARRVTKFEGDLSAWRVALDGAEPVHRATLDAFSARFGPHGFPAQSLRPAYGLAENTLAVCCSAGQRAEDDCVVGTRSIPSTGAPLPGVEVRIVDVNGHVVHEGQEGEILVRSGSLMSGYFRDDRASGEALRDGWLHTGDLGVVNASALHVSGRVKELVIQNGRKFHPYDIERIAADAVDATLAGAAAWSVPGVDGELLVVAVEAAVSRHEGAEKLVRGAVLEALGVRIDLVHVVAPGALPRTTSGKVRRTEVARMEHLGV